VEANIADGLPGFHIVGLGDRSLQEARERVKIAINNSGFEFPGRRVTINLAPAQLPKEGSGFDLAMAAAIVNACEERSLPGDAAWLGELAFDGTIRAIRGTLAIVAHLDRLGVRRFYVPTANLAEARIATAATVVGVNHLRQLKAHWESGAPLETSTVAPAPAANPPAHVDLADIHGQPYAKRALEVAAAGAHHLLGLPVAWSHSRIQIQAITACIALPDVIIFGHASTGESSRSRRPEPLDRGEPILSASPPC
jgi:magnesium chelatase family protein